MKLLDSKEKTFAQKFRQLENRGFKNRANRKVATVVEAIISSVAKNGDKAVFNYTKKFDRISLNAKNISIPAPEMAASEKRLPPKLRAAIRQGFKNIKLFHQNQQEKSWSINTGKSGKSTVGQQITPIERVGLYVPGGTASYPSSLLMNAIPAMVAGVEKIIVCSPTPDGIINPAVLYAAHLCGIKKFYKIGGAQAVAAMAFGTSSIPKVDKITGPGNAYVAEAKRQLFGMVDIDMIAGPSEIAVVADSSANPAWVAADLLSQAEHDELACLVLISTSRKVILQIEKEVYQQVEKLERKKTAKACLKNSFHAILCHSANHTIEIANRLAIEHLELATKDAKQQAKKIKHAGAIFVGHHSPEVLGDYMAGPNHVLPTSGTARFFSPLGVYDFFKRSSVINYTEADFAAIREQLALFAESEGLTAHAKSATIRKK